MMTPVIDSTFDDLRGLRIFAGVRFPRWKAALAGRFAWGSSWLSSGEAQPEPR